MKQTSTILIIVLFLLVYSCVVLQKNLVYTNYSANQSSSLKEYTDDESVKILLNAADKTLEKKFKNVTDKKILAKSGNKKDYHSRAIYYWPKNGLNKTANNNRDEDWEYIDGKINKESLEETDHNNYYDMLTAVKRLALAYKYSNEPKYAEKCSILINEWFIDPKTRMNPHFKYAQAIPGKYDGTPSGIIDTRGILWVIDAIELITDSEYWTESMENKFNDWLYELFDWLLFSDFGKRESKTKNNHGTFYDLQIIKMATFLNEMTIAESFIDSVKLKRISNQIEPNGFQPEEMRRAKPHMYAVFNLSALLDIASIAELYDQDLWNYKSSSSGSIKNAVDYLLSISDFKDNSETKNLMRILPKANELSDGEYSDEIREIRQKIRSFDLTELYFVN